MRIKAFFAGLLILIMAGLVSTVGYTQSNIPVSGIPIDSDLPVLYGTSGMLTDSVIVEFKSYAESRTAQSFNNLPGVIFDKELSTRPIARYKITNGATPLETITNLRKLSGIEEVYPNYRRSAAVNPNDPYFSLQKEELAVAQIPAAWDINTGSASVLVGVIDTGVDTTHPDLIPNLVLPGVNVREGSEWPNVVQDDSGHGTAVSGVIGGVGNNGIGVAGVNWTVKMLPIRAFGGQFLDGDLFDEVEAIDTARERGCDVINLSVGGVGTISVEQKAVTEAFNAGIVLVAAAGNANPGKLYIATGDAATDKASLYYPAALPEVIGVGAVANNGLKAEFSNYGEDILAVMAPGVDIVTTVPEEKVYLYDGDGPPYGLASGTSFATPMVAGVAALILSHFPGLSPTEVRARIEHSAIPMTGPDEDGNGINDYYGYGILNAKGALSQSTSSGNNYLKLGVSANPIFQSEVLVIVQTFVKFDSLPIGSWTAVESSKHGSIKFSAVQNKPGFYIGRFNPGEVGSVSISVHGFTSGAPIPPVTVFYSIAD